MNFLFIKSKFFNKTIKFLYLFSILIIIFINYTQLIKQTINIQKIKKVIHYQPVGQNFLGLQPLLKDENFIGYYTDKDISEPQNNKIFSQAQFVLSPTILDLNNLNHKYIIFDCSTPQVAIDKIKEINAVPLKKHNSGLILVRRQI